MPLNIELSPMKSSPNIKILSGNLNKLKRKAQQERINSSRLAGPLKPVQDEDQEVNLNDKDSLFDNDIKSGEETLESAELALKQELARFTFLSKAIKKHKMEMAERKSLPERAAEVAQSRTNL